MPNESDPELAELRKRRMREIQDMQGLQSQASTNAYAAQQAEMERREAERSEILRRILTPEARERLGRIRLAKPDVAQAIEQQIDRARGERPAATSDRRPDAPFPARAAHARATRNPYYPSVNPATRTRYLSWRTDARAWPGKCASSGRFGAIVGCRPGSSSGPTVP